MSGLAALAALFTSDAMGEAYGEAISIRDHMLQAAELAQRQGLGDALVAAALLHDIGWAPVLAGAGAAHEAAGAAYLLPLFGPAVAEPVRRHVDAKRYLVAREPGYGALLSAESVRTLARQGGPMRADEAEAFASLPSFTQALQLRRIDEDAKSLEAPATRFEDYAPLLQRLLVNRAQL